jgi:hypothetical protein
VGQHPKLGLFDYAHIPLFTLRDYFESDFKKVRDYWSFVVVRDPFSRLPSSISQRFNMYGDQPIQRQGKEEIKREIERSINFLAKYPKYNHHLPAEYIHFQKQVDYVFLDGKRIVDTLYKVDEVGRLLADAGKRLGQDLLARESNVQNRCANRSIVYRNEMMRHLLNFMRPLTRPVTQALPDPVKQIIRNIVYIPRDHRFSSLFDSDYVIDFVRDYYKEDIDMWNEVNRTSNHTKEQSA